MDCPAELGAVVDQSAQGFSLDNVTFSIQPGVIPTLSQWGLIGFGLLLLATMFVATHRRLRGVTSSPGKAGGIQVTRSKRD